MEWTFDFLNWHTCARALAVAAAHRKDGKMFATITECGLLLGDHHQLPSKHRVGSYTSANAEQCAGTMVCDVLSQCILESFGADGGAEAANNTDRDSDDWRKMMKKKKKV